MSGDEGSRTFEAPFFVPPSKDVPDRITLRVIAMDLSTGNSGMDQAYYPVLSERLPPQSGSARLASTTPAQTSRKTCCCRIAHATLYP